MEAPRRVLVIGFGVGNTTHAASLHPSVDRIDLADLSPDVLKHAPYFAAFNEGVLDHPRVSVHINDGRQHLLMAPEAIYDLITLEPPPIAYAGVAALYSRDFYELARSRLKPGGYLSQWLPALQVSEQTNLSMVRAFIDVFPGAVLLSGATADLLLVGARDAPARIDAAAVRARLSRTPAVRRDLERVDLGTVTEIVGTFVGGGETLARATAGVPPVTDDRPLQEYSVQSLLEFGHSVPPALIDLDAVGAWCVTCFVDGRPVPEVESLPAYLALLRRAYAADPVQIREARMLAQREGRRIGGSAYLGAVVPESSEVRSDIGVWLAMQGNLAEAIAEFRRAVALAPMSSLAHWHLGAALASVGATDDALTHLQTAVELDPSNADARNDLAAVQARKAGRPSPSSN
jgi:tetratricopeptide (TPR) repeat protein